MQAVILCGGLGTRLGGLTRSVPKPMVKVRGRPFLEYEVDLLRSNGVEDLVLCVGYLAEQVKGYFGDGRDHGVRIRYSHDGPELLGPAGALKRASSLVGDSFFVTYGDAYLRADYRRAMEMLLGSSSLGLMTVYKNEGRHGKSDVVVRGSRVVAYDKRGTAPGMSWINYGVSALRRESLDLIPGGRFCGEEEFYGRMIREGQLLALPVTRRFYEIGSPAPLEQFTRFISRTAGRASQA